MNIVIKIWLIQTLITVLVVPIAAYLSLRKEGNAKRESIVYSVKFGLACLIPIVSLILLMIVGGIFLTDSINTWVQNDPELAKNKNKVVVPSPPKKKKQKKFTPINNRSEILDL